MDEKMKSLMEEVAALKAENATLKSENKKFKSDMAAMEDKSKCSMAEFKSVETKVAELETKNAELSTQVSEFQKATEDANAAALEAEVSNFKKLLDKRVAVPIAEDIVSAFRAKDEAGRAAAIKAYEAMPEDSRFKAESKDEEGKKPETEIATADKVASYMKEKGIDPDKATHVEYMAALKAVGKLDDEKAE